MILQTMQHPNVVTMKYSFMANSRLYLVMDYVTGADLKKIVDSTELHSIPLSQYRRWFAQLVVALEYIHSKGIIHRDVKPANCMIGK
jgi:serine/threonine protein kinase